MKWKHKSINDRVKKVKQWHDWFAWYPIRLDEEIFWLQRLKRKAHNVYVAGDTIYVEWEYEEY